MPLVIVPLPLSHLEGTESVWRPYVESIAKRGRWKIDVMLQNIASGEVHLILVWDAQHKSARALCGVRRILRADGLVGEMVWMTGIGRTEWTGLLPQLENYMREHQECIGMTAVCRPGWSRTLKAQGYRLTHLVMEKDFSK